MRVYLSPQINDKEQIIKFNNEIVQITVDDTSYEYDFSKLVDGKMISSTEHILSAKRENGELSVEIVNYIGTNASDEERFPQWKTVESIETLDLNAETVPIEWITKEELEATENAPKPLSLEEQLAEKDAQILKLKEELFMAQNMTIQNSETQQELIELLMDMGVI